MDIRSLQWRSLSPTQKGVAVCLPFVLIGLYAAILPAVVSLLALTWTAITYAVAIAPVAIGLLFWASNPGFVKMVFGIASRKLVDSFIEANPVAWLEATLEVTYEKLDKIKDGCIKIQGFYNERYQKLESVQKELANLHASAKTGNPQLYAPKIAILTEQVKLLEKQVESSQKRRDDFNQAKRAVTLNISDLRADIEAKKDKYNSLKEEAKLAREFGGVISDHSEEVKLYRKSIAAMETQQAQFLAAIDSFTEDSKLLVEQMSDKERASMEIGLALIDSYNQEKQLTEGVK